MFDWYFLICAHSIGHLLKTWNTEIRSSLLTNIHITNARLKSFIQNIFRNCVFNRDEDGKCRQNLFRTSKQSDSYHGPPPESPERSMQEFSCPHNDARKILPSIHKWTYLGHSKPSNRPYFGTEPLDQLLLQTCRRATRDSVWKMTPWLKVEKSITS